MMLKDTYFPFLHLILAVIVIKIFDNLRVIADRSTKLTIKPIASLTKYIAAQKIVTSST